MASQKLIIDDEFFNAMGAYALEQGKRIDEIFSAYTKLLNTVRQTSLISGELSGELDAFIKRAEKINNEFSGISENMQKKIREFMEEIDEEDRL